MEIIKPRTLSGFMELLPSKQIRFEKMTEILRTTRSEEHTSELQSRE